MNKLVITAVLLFTVSSTLYCQEESMSPSPIAGASLYFGKKPFTTSHENNVTSFSSADFIYGRLELDGQTIQQAFKMTAEEETHYFLRCWVTVFKDGRQIGQFQPWDYMYIKKGEQKNKALNFDMLPDPAKATTAMSADPRFKLAMAAGPLYQQIRPERFPGNGEYTIRVRFFLETFNAWGNINPMEQWVWAQGEFKFNYDEKDVPAILKNYDTANERVTQLMEKRQ